MSGSAIPRLTTHDEVRYLLRMTQPAPLRILRQQRRLTLRNVAGRVGCSVSWLSRIEAQRQQPSLKMFARIVVAMGATPEEIVRLVLAAASSSEEPPDSQHQAAA